VHKPRSTDPTRQLLERLDSSERLTKMLYIDTKTWLPDDLLLKADKITMANSVELRVPLLDHMVLEFAAKLPSRFKVKGIRTKHILKETFQDLIPREIIERKKTGFPVPYERWLKNELHSYAKDILLDRETLARGYLEKRKVKDLFGNARDGFPAKEIFSLIVLELWHRIFADSTMDRMEHSEVRGREYC